jgi:transposase-like protein
VLNWLKNKVAQIAGKTITMDSDSGVGDISCNTCGHTEEVHLFTHGFGPESQCTMGYQCQTCAKFVTFDSEPIGGKGVPALEKRVKQSRCDCGGRYARNKPIKCPRCKSVRVVYDLGMIT